MVKNPILGLDIGSSSIKAVVAEPTSSGKMALRACFTKPSRGLKRGVVVDMEEASSAVTAVLQEVKQISKPALKNIYLSIGGTDVKNQISRGIIAVSRASAEIYKDDVARAVQASEAVNLPPNRKILHTITREFIVDGVGDIQEPLGMVGARLEVVSFIIDAFQPAVKNLIKCVELAGGNYSGLIFSPLASSFTVLTRNQKELGVVQVDIGYGTTGISVYEENKLLHTKILPVGGVNITTDLAIALKIPVEVAEKLKISYGYPIAREIPSKETIDLKKIDPSLKGTPSKRFISEVIEVRLREICELVNNELRLLGKVGRLPAGVVVSGGGAKMSGIADLFQSELKLSTQIGLPVASKFEAVLPEAIEFLESPEYTTVLGLVLWSEMMNPNSHEPSSGNPITNFIKSLMP